MTVKQIADLSNVGMSLAIAGKALGTAKKKKITTKDIIETGVSSIVGTNMLRISAANVALL